jgi:hypothetical protein
MEMQERVELEQGESVESVDCSAKPATCDEQSGGGKALTQEIHNL